MSPTIKIIDTVVPKRRKPAQAIPAPRYPPWLTRYICAKSTLGSCSAPGVKSETIVKNAINRRAKPTATRAGTISF